MELIVAAVRSEVLAKIDRATYGLMLTDIDPRALERAIGELKVETAERLQAAAARIDGLASGLEARAGSAELGRLRRDVELLQSRLSTSERLARRRIDELVKDAKIDAANYRATLVLANGSDGPTLDLRPLFQRFFDESNMGAADADQSCPTHRRADPPRLRAPGHDLSAGHRRDDSVGFAMELVAGRRRPSAFPKSAIVEACISAYARTLAMCPGAHWRESQGGGRERVTNSALSRILQRPNEYQTINDFMLSTVRDLYGDGNAYALALRNDRFEIDELHLMRASLCRPMVAETETGDVFYALSGNEVVARMFGGHNLVVPQRDVLHIRLTPSQTRSPYPLVGKSPLVSAMLDMATSGAISQQTLTFALNQARPSAVLSTDLVLDRAQAEDLRQRWNDQSRDMNQGRTRS